MKQEFITRICDRCKKEKKMDELKNDFSFRKNDKSIVYNELCDKCAEELDKKLELN